jgi:hypothetical protein
MQRDPDARLSVVATDTAVPPFDEPGRSRSLTVFLAAALRMNQARS